MTADGRGSIDLARPAFVFALALLLANDLVLKAAYPGWVTGKLSDFAGLFALPYFLSWLWPSCRLALHVGVAIAFVAWKLPLSRPFVELWNAAPWFDIARVEDLTDLVALFSIGLSYRASSRSTTRVVHVPNAAIAFVALFAFTATARPDNRAPLRGDYLFLGDVAQFDARIHELGSSLERPGEGRRPPLGWFDTAKEDTWMIPLPGEEGPINCRRYLQYEFDLADFGGALLVRLRAVRGGCDFDNEMGQVVRDFNERIARPAGLRPARFVGAYDPAARRPPCTEEDWARARENGSLNCYRGD